MVLTTSHVFAIPGTLGGPATLIMTTAPRLLVFMVNNTLLYERADFIKFNHKTQLDNFYYLRMFPFFPMHKGLATKESKDKPCLRKFNVNYILAYQRYLLFSSVFLLFCGEKFSMDGIGQGNQKPPNKVLYFIMLLFSWKNWLLSASALDSFFV